MTHTPDDPTRAADAYLRRALEATVVTMSAEDTARLAAARAAALARRSASPSLAQGARTARARAGLGAAAASLAVAALLLVVVGLRSERATPTDRATLDAALLGSADTLEFIEDLEFYEWLDAGPMG